MIIDRCDEISKNLLIDWIQTRNDQTSNQLMLVATTTQSGTDLLKKSRGVLLQRMEPLDQDQMRRMLRSMTGQFPDDGLDLIANAAQGNPYLAISLLFGMLESGNLEWTSQGWNARSLSVESLQGHRLAGNDLSAKMKRLTRECHRLLAAAAILAVTVIWARRAILRDSTKPNRQRPLSLPSNIS